MKTYIVIWTYIANYGQMEIVAECPEDAAAQVFTQFSDDFRARGVCHVVEKINLTTIRGVSLAVRA